MKVFIKGLNGCGMRKTTIQKYCNFLNANGHILVDNPKNSDVILLWTCAFRRDFRDNSISEIKRYQKEFKSELIVAGCLPDIDRGLLSEYFSGRIVNWRDDETKMEEYFGITDKRMSEITFNLGEKRLCHDVAKFKKENPNKDASFVDQFTKLFVAEGCRFKCTYCAERLAFPPYKSFPESELVKECRRLVNETGQLEVMLLGDSVGDYGHDIDSSLPNLIRKLKTINPDLKIALQGLNPAHFIKFYDDMVEFLREGDIRHMQLPIQSASERILKLMQRPYTRADIEKIFTLLNNTDFTEFDTHLIVGFPGETDEDYEETIQFVLHIHPKYVLVSGFMESPAMPAYKLPDKVDSETKYKRLRDAEARIKAAGIICNIDDSELSATRFHTLNLV
ncbi:MAG: radical SAM protein [Candidatus Methanoperedens sp.]|nr:radical SAM protein [Candidatus Methanoperedens sp.]